MSDCTAYYILGLDVFDCLMSTVIASCPTRYIVHERYGTFVRMRIRAHLTCTRYHSDITTDKTHERSLGIACHI